MFLSPVLSRTLVPFLCLGLATPVLAAGVVRDKRDGEEEEIRERIEWFYGQRGLLEAGVDSDALRLLRGAEARATAARVAAQASRHAQRSLWSSIGPASMTMFSWAFGNVSGRVTTISIDPVTPTTLYVGGAAGGFWKSTDDGVSWVNLFESQPTQTIGASAIAAYDRNVIWVGTGDFNEGCSGYFGLGAFRSTDGGATWQTRNGSGASAMMLSHTTGVSLHPTNPALVVVSGTGKCVNGSGSTGGIFYSADAGLTWTEAYSGDAHELVRDASNPNVLYAGVSTAAVVKSTDGGSTWNPANTGIGASSGRVEIAISRSNSQVVYALLTSNSDLYRTTDGGGTWTVRNSNACDGQCSYNSTMKVDITNPDVLYRGTILPYKSTNGGTNFTALTSNWGSAQKVHQDIQHIESHPTDASTIYIGSDGGIWKTTDGGSTFRNLNGNLNMTQFYDIAIHPTLDTVVTGGAQDNSSEAYTGNRTWDTVVVTGDGFVNAINGANPSYCYTESYYGNLFRSTSGPTGNYGNIGIAIGGSCAWYTPFVLDPTNPDTMYVGCDQVWRSTNRGTNFASISPGLGGSLSTLVVAPSDPQVVYAGRSGGNVHRTTDGGTTWVNVKNNLPGRSVTRVAVDPADALHVYVTVSGFNSDHLWYSTNGGASWASTSNGLPNVPHNCVLMVPNPTRVYVGTDVGVFVSDQGDGGPYVPDMNGFPQGVVVSDIEYNTTTNTLTAGTYGRGAWQRDAAQVDTWNVLVGKGAGAPAGNDARIHAYRGDGSAIAGVDVVSFTTAGYGVNTAGGDVTGGGQDEIVAGPGPGPTHPPQGKVFDAAGTPLGGATFTAYGSTGYGLNVAAGLMDSDAMDEILTGPGEGPIYGPQVRAFNADGGTATLPIAKVNFYAYGTLRFGVNVAAVTYDADANYHEIVTGAGPGAVFGPHVRGWNYDGTAIAASSKVNFFAYSTLKYGVNASGGDVDRDGFEEIVTGAGPGQVFGPHTRGFNVDNGTTTAMAKISFFAYATGQYGASVAGGDLDGDGFAEIVTGPGPDLANTARLRGWNFDATAIAQIAALDQDVWPGVVYGLTVATAHLGY